MEGSLEIAQIKARMRTARGTLGIIIILGFVLILFGLIDEGFSTPLFIWALAIIVGGIFWNSMNKFIESPTEKMLGTYGSVLISFVVCWILAIASTYIAWGQLYTETYIGILMMLVATYFMNQFRADGRLLLGS